MIGVVVALVGLWALGFLLALGLCKSAARGDREMGYDK